MRGGGEVDAFSGWRRVLCVFHNNTGIVRYWKRKYAKRVRSYSKRVLRDAT